MYQFLATFQTQLTWASSRHRVDGIAIRLLAGHFGVPFRAEAKHPGGSDVYIFNEYPIFFQGLKLSEREVLRLPPPSDEITKEWRHSSISPDAFMACTGTQFPYTVIFHVPLKQSSPVIGLEWSRGLQEVNVPIFRDTGTGWW